jgi:hypothetical protein
MGADRAVAVLGLMLLGAALGCSQDKVNELLEKGKQSLDEGQQAVSNSLESAKASAESASGTAKEALQLAGKFELDLESRVATSGCYSRLLPAAGERSAVLQLQSYRDAGSESFPSVFLRGLVSADDAASLVGETIAVEMFVQTEPNGPVWFTPRESPVQFTITAADAEQIVGRIDSGELQRTDGASHAVSGEVTGIWHTP